MGTRRYLPGLFVDTGVTLGLFLNWVVVALIVDHAADGEGRKGASLYLAISSLVVNFAALYRSFSGIGDNEYARNHPETVLGLFFELVSLAQGWGCAFCAARVWSLDSTAAFHADPFLHQLGNSIFEMSLVQSGTGWAADPPYTLAERAVAWAAAYIGGILVMNIFIVSVVLSRRGWWVGVPVQ